MLFFVIFVHVQMIKLLILFHDYFSTCTSKKGRKELAEGETSY